jgi:hypothetical protein
MKFQEILTEGRRMTQDERADNLRSLVTDPRFAALIGLIDSDKADFVSIGSAQSFATDQGKMAHCMGSVYALELLEHQIRQITDTPRRGAEPDLEDK